MMAKVAIASRFSLLLAHLKDIKIIVCVTKISVIGFGVKSIILKLNTKDPYSSS